MEIIQEIKEELEFHVIGYCIMDIHMNPVKAGMIKNIKEYEWGSASDYINQDSKIVADKYLNEILNMFKNKDEFIRFLNINDDNLYIDTKEEETEHLENIVNHAIEKFANENKIVDQNQVTIDKRKSWPKHL